MDQRSNDPKHSTYSSKYLARLLIGLVLISAVLVDRVESGDLIGRFLPASIYGHRAAIAFVADILLLGSGFSLFFVRASRISRWPIMAAFALTLLASIKSARDVEELTFIRDLAWIWIAACVGTIVCVAWATSGD